LCKDCEKGFSATAGSAIAYSHSCATVWKEVIRDTINGIAIDKTAESLDLSHNTVFNMRHKILFCVEQAVNASKAELDGVCEADETYILESVKGRKIPENYHRKARKHGAVALKRGLSDEFLCVCTSVDGRNRFSVTSVNRATPSKAEITHVYAEKVTSDTVILCDDSKKYDALDDKCAAAHVKRVNRVNGFHSFIKERLDGARGVASIYLNRYNALFSQIFGNIEGSVDKIYVMMTSRNHNFSSIDTVKSGNLLLI
jgi:hypothetical protein